MAHVLQCVYGSNALQDVIAYFVLNLIYGTHADKDQAQGALLAALVYSVPFPESQSVRFAKYFQRRPQTRYHASI